MTTHKKRPTKIREAMRADYFMPKLFTAFQDGYGAKGFTRDLIAGLTVAVVALPLAMGIAIASGTTPDHGLITAIIAGFIISAFGGSRFQIGGPTAAFIVVVYRTIEHHGYDGMLLATLIAGCLLVLIGLFRLGTYIKYVPYPVTIGFTAGIGITILVGQLADLLGLKTGKLPGEFIPKVMALVDALPTINAAAAGVSVASMMLILVLQRLQPRWPRFLIAVVLSSAAVALWGLPVATIGTKFGGIPSTIPMPQFPAFSLEKFRAVFSDALTIAILAGIESLLSAVVADGMTDKRHRSNIELAAQGLANIASSFFGGLPATGAIARTATNIRSGAMTPVSGMLHALFLLVFVLVAAPLAAYVPLAVLAAILMIVAYNMIELETVGEFLRNATNGDRFVLLATMLLTVFYDLTLGIEIGLVCAAFKFMHNMANVVDVEAHSKHAADKTPLVIPDDTLVYHIHGPFFFGAASELNRATRDISTPPALLIFDMSDVPLIDSTGVTTLKGIIANAAKTQTRVVFTAVRKSVLRSLLQYGIREARGKVRIAASVEAVLASHKRHPYHHKI